MRAAVRRVQARALADDSSSGSSPGRDAGSDGEGASYDDSGSLPSSPGNLEQCMGSGDHSLMEFEYRISARQAPGRLPESLRAVVEQR